MSVASWQEVLTGFDVLAVIAATGAVAAALWLVPAQSGMAGAAIRRRLHRIAVGAFALLTLTTALSLIARSIAISGAPLAGVAAVVPLVLERTDFGRLWIVRAIAVALLWLIANRFALQRQARYALWCALVLVAVVAWTRSAGGHAGDHGDFRLAVWLDWLHLLAAGLWGGVIIAFVLAVAPDWRSGGADFTAVVARRLSTLAAIGLAVAVATGLYNAWRALGGWQPLWTSHYGHLLVIKLGLVTAMAMLGASNRFLHVPRIAVGSSPPAMRALARTVIAEAVVLLVVLGVVALLLHAPPPAAMPLAGVR